MNAKGSVAPVCGIRTDDDIFAVVETPSGAPPGPNPFDIPSVGAGSDASGETALGITTIASGIGDNPIVLGAPVGITVAAAATAATAVVVVVVVEVLLKLLFPLTMAGILGKLATFIGMFV